MKAGQIVAVLAALAAVVALAANAADSDADESILRAQALAATEDSPPMRKIYLAVAHAGCATLAYEQEEGLIPELADKHNKTGYRLYKDAGRYSNMDAKKIGASGVEGAAFGYGQMYGREAARFRSELYAAAAHLVSISESSKYQRTLARRKYREANCTALLAGNAK